MYIIIVIAVCRPFMGNCNRYYNYDGSFVGARAVYNVKNVFRGLRMHFLLSLVVRYSWYTKVRVSITFLLSTFFDFTGFYCVL